MKHSWQQRLDGAVCRRCGAVQTKTSKVTRRDVEIVVDVEYREIFEKVYEETQGATQVSGAHPFKCSGPK